MRDRDVESYVVSSLIQPEHQSQPFAMISTLKHHPLVLPAAVSLAMCASTLLAHTTIATDPGIDVDAAMRVAARKLAAHDKLHPSRDRFPNDAKGDKWQTVGASDWVSGFYPGMLWYMYEYARDNNWPDADVWKERAEGWTKSLWEQQFNSTNHDTGFMMFNSYGHGYRLTKNPDYLPVILNTARSLSVRFIEGAGLIRSWGDITDWRKCTTIMDNMMNLELLIWAAENGGEAYNGTAEDLVRIAKTHSDRTEELLIRPDDSTIHLIEVNPSTGELMEVRTHQGKSADSTWSRGQTWAMYGYAYMAEATGEKRFLDVAKRTSDFYLKHLPADWVPPADFDSTLTDLEFKDSSAAAVAACAFFRLARQVGEPELREKYLNAAIKTLEALTKPPYFSAGDEKAALLVYGARNYHEDPDHWLTNTSLVFGDYYLMEALREYSLVKGKSNGGSAVASTAFARFVPERKDDFAWENDKVAFRTYGPALRESVEDSGIDCWLKRTDALVINSWYAGHLSGERSYHTDHGQGYDPYHVGSSRGCGGTALWQDGAMVTSNTFLDWKIIDQQPDRVAFELVYEYPQSNGEAPIRETKQISIQSGAQFFKSHSIFTQNGKPLASLPVAIGVTTHDGKADAFLSPQGNWVACWEQIDGLGLGTGAVLAPGFPAEAKEIKSENKDASHAVIISKTDENGAFTAYAGFEWEGAGTLADREEWLKRISSFAENL